MKGGMTMLKNKRNGNIILALPKDSCISGIGVFVGFLEYHSIENYEKAVQRQDQISRFISNAKAFYRMANIEGKYGRDVYNMLTDIISWTKRSINGMYSEFQLFSKIGGVLLAPPEFEENAYSNTQLDILKECGYNESWVTDPVIIDRVGVIYASNSIPPEPFSENLLYKALRKNLYGSTDMLYVEGPDTTDILEDVQ